MKEEKSGEKTAGLVQRIYMVGYEDAADSVMAMALRKSELFSGFAAFGVDNFDTSLLWAV